MNYALDKIENALAAAIWAVDDDPPEFKCLFMGHCHVVNLKISRVNKSSPVELLIELQGYKCSEQDLLTKINDPTWTEVEKIYITDYPNILNNTHDIKKLASNLYIKFRGIWQNHCSKPAEKDKEETK